MGSPYPVDQFLVAKLPRELLPLVLPHNQPFWKESISDPAFVVASHPRLPSSPIVPDIRGRDRSHATSPAKRVQGCVVLQKSHCMTSIKRISCPTLKLFPSNIQSNNLQQIQQELLIQLQSYNRNREQERNRAIWASSVQSF
jgi:hypothetical protein